MKNHEHEMTTHPESGYRYCPVCEDNKPETAALKSVIVEKK